MQIAVLLGAVLSAVLWPSCLYTLMQQDIFLKQTGPHICYGYSMLLDVPMRCCVTEKQLRAQLL